MSGLMPRYINAGNFAMTDLFGNPEEVPKTRPVKTEQERLESRFKRFLYLTGIEGNDFIWPATVERVAEYINKLAQNTKPCDACGMKIYFHLSRNGRPIPFTADATCHFDNCTNPQRFRRINNT